jgi:ribosomal-protein-alanine N-acetyltransferase
MMLTVMEPLETQRLLLRHFAPADADDIYRAVYSDAEVCRYYCGQTRHKSTIPEWIIYRSHQSRGNDFGLLAIELKAEHRVIGLCGLQAYVGDWLRFESEPDRIDHPLEVELTYALERRSCGNGYATEACRALIDFAFNELKLRRLVTGRNPANTAAMRLQARLGMRMERNSRQTFCDWVGVLDNPHLLRSVSE